MKYTVKTSMKFQEMALNEGVADEVDGLIKNVKILGFTSKNKRKYTESCMVQAQSLYEGKSIYVSHKRKGETMRDAGDRFGRLQNVHYVKGKGLFGDLQHLTSHPMAGRVREDLTKKLNYFGLSHDADGEGFVDKDGFSVVENITRVNSVDLVSDPATCNSLMEQSMEPTEVSPADQAASAMKAAFDQAVLAVLNDESLDTAGKISKIREVLKAQDKLMGTKEEEEPAAPAEGDSAISEQVQAPVVTSPEVLALQEQVKELLELVKKPKKYIVGGKPAPTPVGNVMEQVGVVPVDPKDARKFFYSK